MFHAPSGFHPILNQGELAALYSFLFLYIASAGAGAFSLDRARSAPAAKRQQETAHA
jgi:putative oxidoreductase